MDNLLQLFDKPHHPILQQVGWTRLAKEFSTLAHFDDNQQELEKSPSFKEKDQLTHEYHLLSQFQTCIELGEFQKYSNEQKKIIHSLNFRDCRKLLEKKEVFTIIELNYYILAYEVAVVSPVLLRNIHKISEAFEHEKKEIKKKLISEFRTFVDYTGHADFLLHPVIGPLVKQLNDHEKKTGELVQEQVRKLAEEGKLQFAGFDIVNGRYVVPYRTDKYNSSLGTIIHRSDSGSTLYIELKSFEEHSLKRSYLKEAIEFEIFNLEKNYSQILKQFLNLIYQSLEIVKVNDYYFAKALWAMSFKGCIPEMTEDLKIHLEDFYHPSVVDPVRNKFLMTNKQGVLLISGPNTGGKSIILKALCINYLLMYAGFPLAASKAELYCYQDIFYLAADGQDLDKGLSSFAAESKKIIHILDSINKKALLMVDEIFNSTSSEEASVIAYAVMNYWQKNNFGQAIFTSHHQTLKSWVHENSSMSSAHVGFDSSTGAPTYVLHLGIPGSSHALEIFEKFLKNSKNRDDLTLEINEKKSANINYEELIRSIQTKEMQMQRDIALEKQECVKLKSLLNAQLMEMETKKDIEYNKFRQKLEDLKKKAINFIPAISQMPKKNLRNIVENEFWKISKEAEKTLNLPLSKEKPLEVVLNPVKEIVVGKKYYSKQWKRTVEVVMLLNHNEYAEIMIGNIKTRVLATDLFESNNNEKQKFISSIDRLSEARSSLDARGMRLDDFEKEVEHHLSFVISGDIPFLDIIHGHGDGVLKNWLWKHLKEHSHVFKYEVPDLSYGGVTKVYLS